MTLAVRTNDHQNTRIDCGIDCAVDMRSARSLATLRHVGAVYGAIAMQKLGLDNLPKPRTKARTALLMAPPELDVRSSFEPGDTVYLTRGARSKVHLDLLGRRKPITTCNCQDAGSTDIERSDHSAQCNKALNWIVRVTYTTQAGHVAHVDSVRLCMADAARLRGQYDAYKPVICRVYPLRANAWNIGKRRAAEDKRKT